MVDLQLLQALPGYTRQDLLDEDARTVNHWQVLLEEVALEEQAAAKRAARRR